MRKTTLCLIVLCLALSACGKGPRKPVSVLDTPEHHVSSGLRLFDQGKTGQAAGAFAKALELDPGFGPALAGQGLVLAVRGADHGGTEDAVDRAEDGYDSAATPAQELVAGTIAIRVYTELARRGAWPPQALEDELVEPTEDIYEDLAEDHPGDAALRYYQAEAYTQGLAFDRAEPLYAAALSMGDSGLCEKADAGYKRLQAVRRAAPRTVVGERIAILDTVTRGDMAALLVQELDIVRFYSRTQPVTAERFRTPAEQAKTDKARQTGFESGDTRGHPFEADIRAVVDMGVNGLLPYPDGSFRPKEPMSRAETAMVFEDIVVRARGENAIATRYIGTSSPFPDLPGDHPAFNAAMVVTTRGVMGAEPRTGRFKPFDTVSGPEVLQAVTNLRDSLQAF